MTLAGINDGDDFQQEADAAMLREQHIEKLIRYAFQKVGLAVDTKMSAVMYEDSTREATVSLEEQPMGQPLEEIVTLTKSGIGSNFRIAVSSDMCLEIIFDVDPNMDNAQID